MSRIDEALNPKSLSTYPGTNVLINIPGIQNQEELDAFERKITTEKLALLYLNNPFNTFDVNHYLNIHKYLFEDIYPFAGQIRSENIKKSFSFCLPQYIYENLNTSLKKANKMIPNLTSREKIIDYITDFYSDLDMTHPFREGNGRTLREYMREYIKFVCEFNKIDCYELDWSKVSREEYLSAVIKADAYLQFEELHNIFDNILVKKEEYQKGKVL